MRGFLYSIVEGLKGLRRARFSTSVSIFTIFISLVIIAIFLIFIFNVNWIIKQIQTRMELEVFIDNSYTQEQIDELQLQIKGIAGVEEIRYISKTEAAEIFRQQFGKDVFEILEENPLPASFQIRLNPEYRSARNAELVFNKILELEGIDEILYREDLLTILEKYMHFFVIIATIVGGLLALSSIILVSNTIKLVIYSRKKIIEIMKLVGATGSFIRRPFLVEGIVQGSCGGLVAALFFYGLFRIVDIEIPGFILIDDRIYALLIMLGLLFGLIGSLIAVRKFLNY